MKKKPKYAWFVQPLDKATNYAIALLVDEEKFSSKTRMWECEIQIVQALRRSALSLGLKFNIFNRKGNGEIRECPDFIFKKKRRKAKTAAA